MARPAIFAGVTFTSILMLMSSRCFGATLPSRLLCLGSLVTLSAVPLAAQRVTTDAPAQYSIQEPAFLPGPLTPSSASTTSRGLSASTASQPTTHATTEVTLPAGPTVDAARAGIAPRADASATNTVPQGGSHMGAGQNVALMVVGGAALVTGLIIGGDGGTIIAIGGAAVGLYGLYNYIK